MIQGEISNSSSYKGIVEISLAHKSKLITHKFLNAGTSKLHELLVMALSGVDISPYIPRYIDVCSSNTTKATSKTTYTTILYEPLSLTGITYGQTIVPTDVRTTTCNGLRLSTILTVPDINAGVTKENVVLRLLNAQSEALALVNDVDNVLLKELNNLTSGTEILIVWTLVFDNKANTNEVTTK